MTIVACVKVQDGIVLGCDSATQISGKDPKGSMGVLKVYENAKKLIEFGNPPIWKLPLGILTYGIGNIGKKSIRTVIAEFRSGFDFSPKKAYQIKDIAEQLRDFLQRAYDEEYSTIEKEQKPVLGVFVAGYSSNSSLGEEWECMIPQDTKVRSVRPKQQFGSSWRGISIPFTRLYFGHDPRADEDLRKAGLSQKQIKEIFEKYKAGIIYDGMPVKDALHLVRFILKTTIALSSFEIGATLCSEPIQTAVIDENGFEWIDKPSLKD